MIEKFADREFLLAEELAEREAEQYEKYIKQKLQNNEESTSESDHPELDEDFEMNAELTGEPCFGAARNEDFLW